MIILFQRPQNPIGVVLTKKDFLDLAYLYFKGAGCTELCLVAVGDLKCV